MRPTQASGKLCSTILSIANLLLNFIDEELYSW